jgi:nucleoside-triphosphatase THEP1
MGGRLLLLSGRRGAGKTTVCQKAVSLAQDESLACGGLLTLNQGEGVLEVVDVRSGDVRRLTVAVPSPGAVRQGRFLFDPGTLSWGNAVLRAATPCHLLVVDELGPLEIERGKGWSSAFEIVGRTDYALGLVVVRPELLAKAQSRLPSTPCAVLDATPHNREDLPQEVMRLLRQRIASPGVR